MMNFPGVLFKDKEVLAKIEAAGDRPIDGHAPGLSGKNLAAYIAAGIASDHECTNQAEALEKLRMGMHIMIREGTTARNLKSLLPIVNKNNSMQCSFCTDDRHPEDLLTEGHINSIVKESVKSGLDIVTAIQIATISTARYFGLKKKGALVPGWDADFIIFDNPDNFNITSVYSKGIKVAENGKYLFSANNQLTAPIRNTVGVNWLKLDFKIEPPDSSKKSVKAKVVGVIPTQIVTNTIIEELQIKNNEVISAPEKDIIKMAVIERHTGSGNVGVCFVKGFGLKAGAIASSVAHDSHNIIVVGTNDKDMTTAAIEIVKMGGGQAAVKNDDILASIPLNIAGLMSNLSIEEMKDRIKKITAAAKELGCVLDDPFMTMSFLALPVIPELKLTDKGLVDITRFDFISMFE